MLTLNLQEVQQKLQEIKQKPKPAISISIVPSDFKKPATDRLQEPRSKSERKELLVNECWKNFNDIRIERAKLSNTINDLVESSAGTSELIDLYEKIESFRPALEKAFKIARHVEQYGELPAIADDPIAPPVSTSDIFILKDKKRKLVDKRCKLQAKIKKGKDPEQISMWQTDLDFAVLEYNEVDEQIKKLEGKL